VATIDRKVEGELAALAQSLGCELVHAEFVAGTLRLFIDREGGVTLDDCAAISRNASALLDVLEFGNGRYVLEVSSPGLDRELYRDTDWQRFIGRRLKATFADPASGRKRTSLVMLQGFDAATRRALLLDEERGERLEVGLDQVVKARLSVEI
jgi:ribosome maturation factor RimP